MKSGALKSVGSARSYRYDNICTIREEDLPESYMITNKPDVLDQGYVNSCVAHGIAECLQANHLKNTGEKRDFSVLAIYGLWRGDFRGEGMFPEFTLRNGRHEGTVIRDIAPENLEVPEAIEKAKEYQEIYPQAFLFKVGNYFELARNEDLEINIKKALVQFDLPIMIVTETGSMRHCEIIIGYNKEKFIVQNSWGEEWGKDGLHEFSVKMIEEAYLVLMDNVKLPFKDTEGHWAEKHIRNLHFAGIINGVTEDEFIPEGYVKRGEVAKIIDMVMSRCQEKIEALEDEIKALKKG